MSFTGYLFVIAAGFFQGSFMLPMKFTRRWAWENTWLIFSITAYLICPWLIAFITLPHLSAALFSLSKHSLALLEIFGMGWGLAAVMFGLGVDMLGLALGFSIILGLSASIGTLIPMIVLSPEKLGQIQGLLTIAAVMLVLAGIVACSWAGKLRDSAQEGTRRKDSRSFALGFAICVASGVLSACGNLGFAFGGDVIKDAVTHGASELMAGNFLWALITIPLFACNAAYSIFLLHRNKTRKLFHLPETASYWALSGSMGVLWIAGFAFYAPGTQKLGSLGTSVGWAIMMATMVVTANVWGILTGEWKTAQSRAYKFLFTGVAILIAAICLIGYSNYS